MTTKIGRNDPCPCGSGKKYKQCCLNKSKPATRRKIKATVLSSKPVTKDESAIQETSAPDLIARTFAKPASQTTDDQF